MYLSDPAGTIRRRKINSARRQDGLIRFGKNNTSQSGEDGIISRLFSLLNTSNETKWCVDVGAWDGKHLSNTYSLLHASTDRWIGVMIEADVDKFNELQTLYSKTETCCINEMVSSIPNSKSNLSYLLKNTTPTNFPSDFEFLCIDVDGADYWLLYDVLHSFFHPKVICIEFNPTMPHDLIYIQPRKDDIRHGSSLAAIVELTEKFHYQLVETTCYNAFFVDKTLYHKYIERHIPFVPSIENVHEITMGTTIYQLYDGSLKLHGCKKLLWHRLPMREEDIQVLKKDIEKVFPFAPEVHNSENPFLKSTTEEPNRFRDISVDVSSYCNTDLEYSAIDSITELKKCCADNLLSLLQKDGFALVRGTGISQEVCNKALSWTNQFLHEAPESVRRSTLTKDRARRGYAPQNTENFASLIGEDEPNDLVLKFRIGPEEGENFALVQPNAWPPGELWSKESADEFRNAVQEYYREICRVAHAILEAICDSLSIENVTMKNHTSILTLLGYRKGARHQGKLKRPLVAAHSDVGVITVLLYEAGGCAVLQRSDGNDGWIDVTLPRYVPKDPVFVINIGDCLSDIAGNGEF